MRIGIKAFVVALSATVAALSLASPAINSIDDRLKDNGKTNHTAAYRLKNRPRLVIRRASDCDFTVAVNNEIEPNEWTHAIKATRLFGAQQVVDIEEVVGNPAQPDSWYFKILHVNAVDDSVHLISRLHVPSTADVGPYMLTFRMLPGPGNGAAEISKDFPRETVILFNPWSSEDAVYYENEKERKEYVETEDGLITWQKKDVMGWRYGQFDEAALDQALEYLSIPFAMDRSDPRATARELAARCHWRFSPSGLLEGRWDGNYGAGTNPASWSGTNAILRAYAAGGNKPVKYAQCWNMACALTTFLRSVGIPARPISAYTAAIDNTMPPDGHIDYYYKIDRMTPRGPVYALDPAKGEDSDWGFHVWTEAWMKRPDQNNADGWQELDPTSQAKTPPGVVGLKKIGPAPREILRAAATPPNSNYDTDFMWSTVRADRRALYQKAMGGAEYVVKEVQSNSKAGFAKVIRTKVPGKKETTNIAANFRPASRTDDDPPSGIDLELAAPAEIAIGDGALVTLTVTNNDVEPRDVTLSLTGMVAASDSETLSLLVLPDLDPISVPGGGSSVVNVSISSSVLIAGVRPLACDLRLNAAVACEQLESARTEFAVCVLVPPPVSLTLSPSGPFPLGSVGSAVVAFTNSSPVNLTNVTVVLSCGAALAFGGESSLEISVGSMAPGDSVSLVPHFFNAALAGASFVQAALISDQLPPSVIYASADVVTCPGDMTFDGFVDDEDFVLFASAYDIFACESPAMPDGCPADLSGDGFVDDADFVRFIDAYQALFCW